MKKGKEKCIGEVQRCIQESAFDSDGNPFTEIDFLWESITEVLVQLYDKAYEEGKREGSAKLGEQKRRAYQRAYEEGKRRGLDILNVVHDDLCDNSLKVLEEQIDRLESELEEKGEGK